MTSRLDALTAVSDSRLGELVRQARLAARMSREEVAVELCVDATTIDAWEAGLNRPPVHALGALAAALGIPVRDLVPPRGALPALDEHGDPVENLVRLVSTLRGTPPGGVPAFRGEDLDALAVALGTDVGDLDRRVAEVIACSVAEARVVRGELVRHRAAARV